MAGPRRMIAKPLVRFVAIAALQFCTSGVPYAGTPAQPDSAGLDALRVELRHDPRALYERTLSLTEREAKAFWPLHERYQRDLDPIARRHNRAVIEYVESEDRMTEPNAKRILTELLAADRDEQRLRESHYRKIIGVLPPKKAARYIQLENRIDAIRHYDLAERLPLVR